MFFGNFVLKIFAHSKKFPYMLIVFLYVFFITLLCLVVCLFVVLFVVAVGIVVFVFVLLLCLFAFGSMESPEDGNFYQELADAILSS